MNHIEFPGLGLEFFLNPVALEIPFLSGGIRWYSIFIVCGIILACIVCFPEYKRLKGNPDDLYNMLLWGLPTAIIGARLYYVLFTLDQYESFGDMFKIWEGGLAIYGGVIATIIVVYIYCKRHKLSFLMHMDIGTYGFLLGQAIGRWGNFVNGEAFGSPTDLPWRMIVNGVVAHPTFFYESMWLLLGFIIIWCLRNKNPFHGKAACFYLVWYGMERAFVETLRTDSLMLGTLRISSVLSAFMVIAGIVLYIKLKKSGNRSIKL